MIRGLSLSSRYPTAPYDEFFFRGEVAELAFSFAGRFRVSLDIANRANYLKFMNDRVRETHSVRIARILAERIIGGQIGPGTRLLQDHVAKEFGASHVPVREAFRELQAQGLAEALPRRGYRVTGFDLAELQEVAEMRASLEALALRLAAPNISRKILLEAEEVTRQGDAAKNVRDWEATNRHFHHLILSPCRRPRLLRAIDDLHTASARFLFATWRRDWEAWTDLEHRRILDALRKGETDVACTALAQHVGWSGKRANAIKNASISAGYEILV